MSTSVQVPFAHSLEIDAPASAVWDYITDWERHGEWIPFTRVEMEPGPTTGVGVRFRAWSGLGPIGFWDPMTVTEFEEYPSGGGRCVIVHTGRVVKGDATLVISDIGPGRCRLDWSELFAMSRPAAAAYKVGSVPLHAGLRKALADMAGRVESGRV